MHVGLRGLSTHHTRHHRSPLFNLYIQAGRVAAHFCHVSVKALFFGV
jgi:hypothetical protein